MNSLPTPFLNYIPKLFRQDSKAVAFASRMDIILGQWKADMLKFRRLYRFDECDSLFLNEIAFLLNVTFLNQDSDSTRRLKLKNAIPNQQHRGTWTYSVKPQLDAITGLNAVIMSPLFRSGEWYLMSTDTSLPEPLTASLGTNGVTSGLGLDLSGSGDETNIPGNIYINAHLGVNTAVLTATQIAQIIVAFVVDIVPAYYQIFIGYIDVNGNFNLYQKF